MKSLELKLAEIKANMDALKDKTPQERHAAIKQQRVDLTKWAQDNNIPMQYLKPGMGMGAFHGHHMMDNDANDT